jgi:hypothetical protein
MVGKSRRREMCGRFLPLCVNTTLYFVTQQQRCSTSRARRTRKMWYRSRSTFRLSWSRPSASLTCGIGTRQHLPSSCPSVLGRQRQPNPLHLSLHLLLRNPLHLLLRNLLHPLLQSLLLLLLLLLSDLLLLLLLDLLPLQLLDLLLLLLLDLLLLLLLDLLLLLV